MTIASLSRRRACYEQEYTAAYLSVQDKPYCHKSSKKSRRKWMVFLLLGRCRVSRGYGHKLRALLHKFSLSCSIFNKNRQQKTLPVSRTPTGCRLELQGMIIERSWNLSIYCYMCQVMESWKQKQLVRRLGRLVNWTLWFAKYSMYILVETKVTIFKAEIRLGVAVM